MFKMNYQLESQKPSLTLTYWYTIITIVKLLDPLCFINISKK